jgi:hypothetical protein
MALCRFSFEAGKLLWIDKGKFIGVGRVSAETAVTTCVRGKARFAFPNLENLQASLLSRAARWSADGTGNAKFAEPASCQVVDGVKVEMIGQPIMCMSCLGRLSQQPSARER